MVADGYGNDVRQAADRFRWLGTAEPSDISFRGNDEGFTVPGNDRISDKVEPPRAFDYGVRPSV